MEALIYLAKSSAILSLFFLIYSVFLNKETFFKANRIYLVSGVFVALILPFISINKIIYVAPTPLTTDVFKSTEFIQVATTATEPTAAINWIYVFGVLYALGGVIYAWQICHSNHFGMSDDKTTASGQRTWDLLCQNA